MKDRIIYYCSNCTKRIDGQVHALGGEFFCDEACMGWAITARDANDDAAALEGELDAVATGPKAVTAD